MLAEKSNPRIMEEESKRHLPQADSRRVQVIVNPIAGWRRRRFCQAVVDGGFLPFLVEPVNFPAMYQSSKKKMEGETAH